MLLQHTSKELDALARLMRAEAIGEGDMGMLMVGNVVVNRAIANWLTFTRTPDLNSVIYATSGGFAGINSELFLSGSATTKEKDLASRVIRGEYYYPATNALWFYAPKTGASCVALWYDQRLAGRYKAHCFYQPYEGVCKELH